MHSPGIAASAAVVVSLGGRIVEKSMITHQKFKLFFNECDLCLMPPHALLEIFHQLDELRVRVPHTVQFQIGDAARLKYYREKCDELLRAIWVCSSNCIYLVTNG